MLYELLKVTSYSCDGNIGWDDADCVEVFSATRRSLRRQFARELNKRGVDVSCGAYKFESYGEFNEHIELVEIATDLPIWAAVCGR